VQGYSDTAVNIYVKIQIFPLSQASSFAGISFLANNNKVKGLSDEKAHHTAEKLLSQIGFGRFTKGYRICLVSGGGNA